MEDAEGDESTELVKLGIRPEKALGSGSYSRVKSAIWKKNEDDDPVRIALKIINRATAPVEFKKKFLPRELKILNNLKHPNIIEMYNSFNIKNKTYICLEYAGHGDLLEFVQVRGPLAEDQTRKIFGAICAGISYLHSKDVVHRDLKCENILIAHPDDVKIADFGFAREIGMSELSKTFCGSAAYASPEIIRGIAYEGRNADIWSLGVILFIMRCCVMPFRDHSKSALLQDQCMPLRYPAKVAGNLAASYKDLASGILNHVTRDRFTLEEIQTHPWMDPTCVKTYQTIESTASMKMQKESSMESGYGSSAASSFGSHSSKSSRSSKKSNVITKDSKRSSDRS